MILNVDLPYSIDEGVWRVMFHGAWPRHDSTTFHPTEPKHGTISSNSNGYRSPKDLELALGRSP